MIAWKKKKKDCVRKRGQGREMLRCKYQDCMISVAGRDGESKKYENIEEMAAK